MLETKTQGACAKACPHDAVSCVNFCGHFQKIRPHIREAIASKHFLRDAPDFDAKLLLDCEHQYFTHLHKFEETVNGNHVFRALWQGKHIVYAVDTENRLVLLRAFDNTKTYKKFLDDKKKLLELLEP